MAEPIAAVWQILKEDATVYGMTDQAVYPNILPPEPVYPAIVYGQLSKGWIHSKDGSVEDGWRFQVEIFAENYGTLRTLATAVEDALHPYNGTVGQDVGFVRIRAIDESDALWEEQREVFKIIQDYSLKTR